MESDDLPANSGPREPDRPESVDQRSQDRIDRTSAYYDRFADDVARRIERRDFTRAFDAFCRLVVPGKPVIDVGSGSGAHLREFQNRGIAAIGVEPSARMRELSEARGLAVVDGSFEELPWLELPEAGGVWCAASLLHVPLDDVPSALVAVRELLARHAPLFVTVRLGDGGSWDRFDGADDDVARFIQLFDPEELMAHVRDAGFEICDSWTEESTWGRPSTWISILARKPG